MHTRNLYVSLLAVLVLAGCEGSTGPVGPVGPPGPPAESAIERHSHVTTIRADGTALAIMPAGLGKNPNHPPPLTCYTGRDNSSWALVREGCAATLSLDRWVITLSNGRPGWLAAFVVVY